MENIKNKCSSKKHSEINAICFCQECRKYFCNKCQNYHLELFEEHQTINIDKNINVNDIFTGFCQENNHSNKLNFFCNTHNKLICVECICKIKDEKIGGHFDCSVCKIENIQEEKKNKLKENIKCLEDLSKSLENSIFELKKEFEKINEKKEKIKLKIQETFTKIRNVLNEREDELLLKIEEKYDNSFIDEKKIRDMEKLPNKIKIALEKGKIIENDWNNDNLSLMLNNCINIENNIINIKLMNSKINKINKKDNNEIEFTIKENEINVFLNIIKNFGCSLFDYSLKFKWKKGPNYTLSNNDLIATKTSGGDNYNSNVLGDIIIPKNQISKWKIKLIKFSYANLDWTILIGVSPSNINQKENDLYNKTWTFICGSSNVSIKSGSQTPYKRKKERLKEGDIIEVIMNTINGELSFSVNDVNYGIACTIPTNIDLSPFISLYNESDSIELLN